MSEYRIPPGSSTPRLYFRWWSDDDTPKTDGAAAAISAASYLRKSSGVWPASGTTVGALTDGAEGDSYMQGKVIRHSNADGHGNLYSIDPPTAAAATGATAVRLLLTVSNGSVDPIASVLESQTVDVTTLDLLADALAEHEDIVAIKAKTDLLGSGNVTVGAPVADNGSIPIIYQGDDYAAGRKLSFTFNSSGFAIDGASSRFEAEPTQGKSFAAAGTITDNEDGTATAEIPITSAQSALLETGPVSWSALNITSAGLRETVAKGSSPLERRKHG